VRRGVGVRSGLLVDLQQRPVAHELRVVVVVDGERRVGIEEGGGVGVQRQVGGAAGVEHVAAEGLVHGAAAVGPGEAVAEGGAVRAADGVGAEEHDGLLGGEAPRGEVGEHVVEPGEGRGQVDLPGIGPRAVAAPQRDVVAAAAEELDGVPGRERERVGAGDGTRAGGLERALGGVDGAEAAQGVVGNGGALGGVARRGRDQDGGVAAADEAVVEEQPDEGGRQGRVRVVEALHGVAHDGLRVRARRRVVRRVQSFTGGRHCQQQLHHQQQADDDDTAHHRHHGW